MRPLTLKTNVDPAVFPWNYGRSRDNTGLNNGTPLNEDTLGDYIQFFDRMMFRSGVVPNNLIDNGANGWQLHQALQQTIMAYKNIYTYVGSAALTDDNFGSLNVLVNFVATGYTFTMPASTLGNITKKITILNSSFGGGTLTIAMPGGNVQNPGYTIVLGPNDSVDMMTIGVGQYQITRIFRYKKDKATQTTLATYGTTTSGIEQITGAQFITPAGDTRNYKITICGRMLTGNTVNSDVHGADIYLQDQTLAVNLARGRCNFNTNSTGAGMQMEWQFCVTTVYKNVNPVTTLGAIIIRLGSVNVTLQNVVWLIEEISENAI